MLRVKPRTFPALVDTTAASGVETESSLTFVLSFVLVSAEPFSARPSDAQDVPAAHATDAIAAVLTQSLRAILLMGSPSPHRLGMNVPPWTIVSRISALRVVHGRARSGV